MTADHAELVGWLDDPSTERGVRFRTDDRSWQRLTYAELADRTRRAGVALAEAGVRPGDVVPLVLPAGPDFVTHFFGLLAIGATPSVLPLPMALRAGEGYQNQLRAISARIRARHAIVDARYHDVVRDSVTDVGADTAVLAPTHAEAADGLPRAYGELAVLQFTSGSRGNPRGLRITTANLAENLRMIRSWLDPDGGRTWGGVTWLPLYHDMGLIGGLLTGVCNQAEHALMRPEQFILDTTGWLAEYGTNPYTTMCMPNFGFERVLKRIRPKHLAGLDFSSVRSVVTGAERIDPAVLTGFAGLLEPYGFDLRALMPAYGLAEGTLAVTGVGSREVPRLVRVGELERRLGDKLDVRAVRDLTAEAPPEPWRWQVSCGRPLGIVQVDILDEDGIPQPEGVLGEIFVEGPSVADGYVDATAADRAKLSDGRLRTGDAGFLLDGELYVVGRLGDSMKINGQSVFVEDIELELVASDTIPRHQATVIAGVVQGKSTVLVVTERPLGDRAGDAVAIIRTFVGDAARVRVLDVVPGTIPVTSSRKPRRRELWLSYVSGELKERNSS